jgi:hypothetical protein
LVCFRRLALVGARSPSCRQLCSPLKGGTTK